MDEENGPLLIPMEWHEPIRCEQSTQAFFEADLWRPAKGLRRVRTITDPILVEEFSNLPAGEKGSIPKEAGTYFITFPSYL